MPAGQRVSTETVNLHGVYKVVDAGIEAGEDFEGWMSEFYCEAKLRDPITGAEYTVKLWHVLRNEFDEFLASVADDDEAMHFDGLPTTNENQYFFYYWKQRIDWEHVISADCVLVLNEATDEWAAASAMTAYIYLEIEEAPLPLGYVEAFQRGYCAAGTTERQIAFPRGQLEYVHWTLSAGYATERVLAQDKTTKILNDAKAQLILGDFARAAKADRANPSADLPSTGRTRKMSVAPHIDRYFSVVPSESAALLGYAKTYLGGI